MAAWTRSVRGPGAVPESGLEGPGPSHQSVWFGSGPGSRAVVGVASGQFIHALYVIHHGSHVQLEFTFVVRLSGILKKAMRNRWNDL